MSYLVFDIESVVDEQLIYETCQEIGETRDDTIARVTAEQVVKQQKDPPFMPSRFQVPVSVCMLLIDDSLRYIRHKTIGGDPSFVSTEFWKLVYQAKAHYDLSTFVSFNGIRFDMPVMEINAHRNRVKLPGWLVPFPKYASDDPRGRYNRSAHFDLFQFLATDGNVGGSLDYWATLIGLPGKICMSGSSVAEVLKRPGGQALVDDYCLSDVLNTYALFVYIMRSTGTVDANLPLSPHMHQVDEAVEKILAQGGLPENGCTLQWITAYRNSKLMKRLSETLDDDDEPPF